MLPDATTHLRQQRWRHRDGFFDLGTKSLVMGVLNVTPDSFSDGGHYLDPEVAVTRALAMVEEGADIIDVGGESTRPGAGTVDADEELRRLLPVVERLAGRRGVVISVDTRKAVVADRVLQAGAHIINDVSGLGDPAMAPLVARHGAGLVLMHMQGQPVSMQDQPVYGDVLREVGDFLCERIGTAKASGVDPECVAVDPGIGFGKTLEHNIALLRGIPDLIQRCDRPLLAGISRKRMIGAITGREMEDRLAGSLAAASFALMQGARIIRVHDVKESCDVARVIDRLNASSGA